MLSTAMVKPILETMYQVRHEMVPCFIGPPGIGKTQGLYEFAKEKGVNVVTFILSNTVPSEVSGIRMPDKETKKMEVFDDMRMASLQDGDILFFDEILEAPPMLWSACLTLIQDRIMASGRRLPDVFIVAASNKVASPGIIPASTRDRFQFIELEFDSANWDEWMYDTYGVDVPSSLIARIQSDSTTYNILTPRRVVKLYEYAKTIISNGGSRDIIRDIIEDMFDFKIASMILDMADQKHGIKYQIKSALIDLDPSIELPESFMDMSYQQILECLSARDDWEIIKEALKNIEGE